MTTPEVLTCLGFAATGGLLLWTAARLGRLKAESEARLGALARRVGTIDKLADSESVRVETRLLAMEKAGMDAAASHASLESVVGNDLFALKGGQEGLWHAVKFLKKEAGGECQGKGPPEAAKGWSIGQLVTVKGGTSVEFVATDARDN
jgi:hypothetical protein